MSFKFYNLILLILFLVLPSTIEFAHAFEEHKILECCLEKENHYHQNDFKCEFCHLQFKTFTTIQNEVYSFIDECINFKKINKYQFLSSHRELLFSLRGPPIFNFL